MEPLKGITLKELLSIPYEVLIKEDYNKLTSQQKRYYYDRYGKPPRCRKCNSRLKLRYKSDDEVICENGCYRRYNGNLATIIEYEELFI